MMSCMWILFNYSTVWPSKRQTYNMVYNSKQIKVSIFRLENLFLHKRHSFWPKSTYINVLILLLIAIPVAFYLNENYEFIYFGQVQSSEWQDGMLNMKRFQYTIQQKSCKEIGISPDLLVAIYSKADNFGARQTLRETWGNVTFLKKFGSIRVVFILGEVICSNIYKKIIREALLYEDVLMGSFPETYHNLIYKSSMMLRWYINYCPEAKVLLKADDDTFINTPTILSAFKTDFWERTAFPKDAINLYCMVFYKGLIYRDIFHRYYVPETQIKGTYFPHLCYGLGIFFQLKSAKMLYEAAKTLKPPYVWIDDAFITGVVRDRTNVTLIDMKEMYQPNGGNLLQRIKDDQKGDSRKYFVGPNQNELLFLRELWNATVENIIRTEMNTSA